MEVLHAPTHFNEDYLKIRRDYKQDTQALAERYGQMQEASPKRY